MTKISVYAPTFLILLFLIAPNLAANEAEIVARRWENALKDLGRLHVRWEVKVVGAPSNQIEERLFSLHQKDEFAIAFDLGDLRYRRHWDNFTDSPVAGQFWHARGITYHQEIRGEPDKETVGNYFILKGLDDEGIRGQLEQANQYFEYIGSPIYDGKFIDVWRREARKHQTKTSEPPKSDPFSVPQCLRTGKYAVTGKVRQGDFECEVWERVGRDKLYLAPSLGYALVRREWSWNDGSSVMMIYDNSDFKKLSDDAWLPMKCKRDFLISGSDKALFSSLVTVSKIETGQRVSEKLFDPDPKLTCTVLDNTVIDGRTISYILSKDSKATQDSIDLARQRVFRSRNKYYSYLALGLCVVLIAVFFFLRWKQGRRLAVALVACSLITSRDAAAEGVEQQIVADLHAKFDRIRSAESVAVSFDDCRWALVKKNRSQPENVRVFYVRDRDRTFMRTENLGGVAEHPLTPDKPLVYLQDGIGYKYWESHRKLHIKGGVQHIPCTYLEQIGLWLYPGEPINRRYYFPSIFADYHSVEFGESSDELWLTIYSSGSKGSDRVLFRQKNGQWLLCRRELATPRSIVRQDSRVVMTFDDHRNIGNDLWLPFKIASVQLRPTLNGDEEIVGEQITTALELQIGANTKVPAPVIHPGTIIEDEVTEKRTILPGGEDLLKQASIRAGTHFGW